MQLLFISGAEIFVILFVIVLLFGADKIPELARGLAKGMNEVKKVTSEIKREIDQNEVVKTVKDTTTEIQDSVKSGTHEITDTIDDVTREVNKIKR